MDAVMPFHVFAGALGMVAGAIALAVAKGATLHRRSGRVFVYAMVALAATGVALAFRDGPDANALGGAVAGYLVVTAMTTVRPATPASRRLDVGAALFGLAVGATSLALAVASLSRGGNVDGVPTVILVLFAAMGLLGGAGDLKVLRSGALRGARRLARHVWRMCWALWIAVSSFFLGQSEVLPEALRAPALLALPVVGVLVVMIYWLVRLRVRGGVRGLARLTVRETSP